MVIYAVLVFYNALPQYLTNELIRIEKRAISIIMPGTSYNNACEILGITPIMVIILIHYVISYFIASHLMKTIR